MANKRRIREMAMQVLFLWDSHKRQDMDLAQEHVGGSSEPPASRQSAMEMAEGAWGQRETIDAWIERLAPQWPPHRQPIVDRNILRLAVWEMNNTDTPSKVVLDEAIELAKAYSTEHSAAFVNGVLDAVLKERERLTGGLPNPPA
jgi:transcription antitermination protein NusB